MCEAMRVEPINPLANYIGTPKDIEDLKQKTKLKKQLEKRTETEFVKHLKRAQVHNPLLTMDLPEKQEEEEIQELQIEVKKQVEEEYQNGIFQNNYDKYDYLLTKEKLTKDEQEWIEKYKETNEYNDIYGEDKEVFNAQTIC